MEKIERISLAEKAVGRIQSFLDSGTLLVGDRLPTESEFCEELGVGRSTLREAFRMLQAYRVRSFSVSENMSHALEPHGRILRAIARCDEKEAAPAVLAHLELTLEDMQRVTAGTG